MSEDIILDDANQPTDFLPMFGDFGSKFPFKPMIAIFIVLMLMNSDVFLSKVLSEFKNTTHFAATTTTWGTFIQSSITILMIILIFYLTSSGIL